MQAESGPSAGSRALRVDSRPIKVDVSLVLVSVSVVDPLNREVVGLGKQDFEVFEGKEKQAIQHFSSEDAGVAMQKDDRRSVPSCEVVNLYPFNGRELRFD